MISILLIQGRSIERYLWISKIDPKMVDIKHRVDGQLRSLSVSPEEHEKNIVEKGLLEADIIAERDQLRPISEFV